MPYQHNLPHSYTQSSNQNNIPFRISGNCVFFYRFIEYVVRVICWLIFYSKNIYKNISLCFTFFVGKYCIGVDDWVISMDLQVFHQLFISKYGRLFESIHSLFYFHTDLSSWCFIFNIIPYYNVLREVLVWDLHVYYISVVKHRKNCFRSQIINIALSFASDVTLFIKSKAACGPSSRA